MVDSLVASGIQGVVYNVNDQVLESHRRKQLSWLRCVGIHRRWRSPRRSRQNNHQSEWAVEEWVVRLNPAKR